MASNDVPGSTDGWWLRLYDDHLADLLLERPAEPMDVVDFLIERLDLRPGDRVFDQCCGIGSLAVPLAQRGLAVVGCDLMPGYIRRAREKARAVGAAVDLRVADAFRFVPARACYHEALGELLRAVGFRTSEVALDPLRLRVVRSGGDLEIPAARAVYYPHRDTWYAHPQTLITWWIPLDDLVADETFVFFPERFAVPVPNDSERFDYDAWVANGWDLKIGWQRKDSGLTARYPGLIGQIDAGRAVGFSCARAQSLLFSGAHFHQTLPQASGQTRFSLDFRLVHLGDEAAGLGAPNVDARARGSALRDYLRMPTP